VTLHRVTLKEGADLDGFRHAVRGLMAQDLAGELTP